MSTWVARGVLLLVLSLVSSGCVTSKLWEDRAFDGLNQPAQSPNVQVFKVQDDWLVQYDEVSEKGGRARPRAYYLKENADQIRDHKRPRFVPPPTALEFSVAHTVISTNSHEFVLYDGPSYIGTYELPVYPAPSGRVKQLLLTPLTVAVDATLTAACIAVYAWGHSGTTCYH